MAATILLCSSLSASQGPCPTLILPLAPELCPSQRGDQYPTLKMQTRSCAWLGSCNPNSSSEPGCVELMLQCRLKVSVVLGHLIQTSPNRSVIWAQSHLSPPPPNNCTEQISNSNKDPAKNMFKDRLLCCFPDNTRMISCTRLLLCLHPAGKNPISKQLMLHHY